MQPCLAWLDTLAMGPLNSWPSTAALHLALHGPVLGAQYTRPYGAVQPCTVGPSQLAHAVVGWE